MRFDRQGAGGRGPEVGRVRALVKKSRRPALAACCSLPMVPSRISHARGKSRVPAPSPETAPGLCPLASAGRLPPTVPTVVTVAIAEAVPTESRHCAFLDNPLNGL